MRKNYKFDWTQFTEENFLQSKIGTDRCEDEIYGFMHFTHEDRKYYVDIHYMYYNAKDKGYDLEIYGETEDGYHGPWLDSIKSIISSSTYLRFCRRVENAIIKYFA